MLKPVKYTSTEGGYFKSWAGGELSPQDLEKREFFDEENSTVLIKGVIVHSIIFEPFMGKEARWDCVNGWATNPKQGD